MLLPPWLSEGLGSPEWLPHLTVPFSSPTSSPMCSSSKGYSPFYEDCIQMPCVFPSDLLLLPCYPE